MDVLRIVFIWRRENAKRPILEEPLRKNLKLHEEEKKTEERQYEELIQETLKRFEENRPRPRTDYEYSSGEDDDYVWPDGTRRRTREEWARYYKQVEESEGFDVDPSPDTCEHGFTALTNMDNEVLINCAKSAIEHFNEKNDTCYKFVKIEKTTCIVAAGMWYYITFQAVDREAEPKSLQAITFYGLDKSISVELCRLKPTASL